MTSFDEAIKVSRIVKAYKSDNVDSESRLKLAVDELADFLY
ncbi:MAG: hypothetical protein ACFFEK_07510 [Candidatus Thorarchaeota archaeon]